MKRYIPLLLVVLCLTACNTEKKEMKEVAYNYCFATGNYQIDEAEHYATKETIEKTLPMARFFVSQIDTAYIVSDTPAEITITKVKRTTDTTAFAIYHKITPIKDFSDTLQLRKREGKWLAHAPIKTVHRTR